MVQKEANRIVINADLGDTPISKYIYGHFIEHLGRCIYGGLWVGEDSHIPNTRGIRNDVLKALRAIDIPVLRWPGGCFADEYHWQNGIGPREDRPASINTHWGGVTENNHFGTHEFMDLCDLLGCEPYICGNIGSGTVEEMQRWVEYLNSDGKNPMADLRTRNGRAEPWSVHFWGVGNENWGCGGNMRAEFYADLYRRYSTYCRNFGENKLYKIAGGANTDDYHWTEVLMREAGKHMDALSLHYYTVPGSWENKGSSLEFDEREWFITLQKALYMDELIIKHKAIMDCYDPEKRVGLVVDEWGTWYEVLPNTNPSFLYQQNTLRDALVAAITLNLFNTHCDRITMANIAQTLNVLQALILTKEDSNRILLTPTYHVFEMYKVHQGGLLLSLTLDCESYSTDDGELPAVSASASRDEMGRIHLTLCNLRPDKALTLTWEIRGTEVNEITGRILNGKAINTHNTFDHPEAVMPAPFMGLSQSGNVYIIDFPPHSVLALTAR